MNMNNAEIIKGIDMTIAGLETIKNALAGEATSAPAPKATKNVAKAVEKKSEEAPAESAGEYTREELENMKYNDLKKYGASLGVKCVGTRDEIIDKILAVGGAPAEDDGEDDEPKSKSKTSAKSAPAKKLGKKSEPVEDEPAEEEDEFEVQAKEVAEDTSAEEIIEALSEVGVKANKKNYVEKLADALRKGLIDLSDDDDGEESGEDDGDEAGEDGAEAVDFDAETYFEEFDPEGYNNPENMNDDRAEAVKVLMESILDDIDKGEITADDIASYIDDNATEDEKELISDPEDDAQVIGLYCELRKRMVDDEGAEHEPSDPYEVNGDDFCCGHQLKYVKKSKKFVCEICGEEYEQ